MLRGRQPRIGAFRTEKAGSCLVVVLVLASCTEGGRSATSGRGESLRPGEKNQRMSEEATAEVRACAREYGWKFKSLRVLVDSAGVLIRAQFKAQRLSSDAEPQALVLNRCLTRAGVRNPLSS